MYIYIYMCIVYTHTYIYIYITEGPARRAPGPAGTPSARPAKICPCWGAGPLAARWGYIVCVILQ